MKSKRIQWLDFARGLMIFSVVVMHVLDNVPFNHIPFTILVNKTLAIFAMPMFFVISGYLYKKTDTINKFLIMLYKKCTSFIIPYVVFTCVSIFISLNNGVNPIYFLYLPIDYLWFIYSLFFIFIAFGILDLFNIKFYIQFIISIMCLILSFIPSRNVFISVVNPVVGIGGFMIFFFIGRLIKRYHLLKYIYKLNVIYGLSIIFIVLLVVHFSLFRWSLDTNFMNIHDIFIKLFSIPVLLGIFIRAPRNLNFKYFSKIGRESLVIYLMQSPIISILFVHVLFKYIPNFCMNHFIIILVFSLIISWFLCVIACYFTKIKVINFLFYPRKYINKLINKL